MSAETIEAPVAAPVPPLAASAGQVIGKTFDIDCTLSYEVSGTSDFIFLVHALHGMDQQVLSESLEFDRELPHQVYQDPTVHHRFLRVHAESGGFTLRYRAQVRRVPEPVDENAPEVPLAQLPHEVLHNLMPTRYCESDLLGPAAQKLFGQIPMGHQRVQAISDWVHDNIEYRIGSTNATTTARDVFVQRAGVCRDFAHLAVTFCRALNIPARLVVGYSQFEEPPPDFHAIFEAFVGGRWVMFDPTRLVPVDDLVRIAVGRDAKDVAFATLFGPACMTSMAPLIQPAA
jgi:transglutaminase-like putative cysteine protease